MVIGGICARRNIPRGAARANTGADGKAADGVKIHFRRKVRIAEKRREKAGITRD